MLLVPDARHETSKAPGTCLDTLDSARQSGAEWVSPLTVAVLFGYLQTSEIKVETPQK